MAHQFSDEERKRLARQGKAMPDGGYPIRNREDLVNAVRAYGRGNNKEEVKKWIKKRAKELDAEQYLPDNWRVDDDDSLAHHGIKGMKWGVRRYQNKDGSLTPRGRKRYSERQSASDFYRRSAAKNREYAAASDKVVEDLKTPGKTRDRVVKKMFGNDIYDKNFDLDQNISDLSRILSSDSESYRKAASKYDRMADRLSKADLSDRTFLEKAKSSRSRGKAITASLTAAVGAYQIYEVASGQTTVGMAVARSLGGLALSMFVGSAATNTPGYYFNKEVEKGKA